MQLCQKEYTNGLSARLFGDPSSHETEKRMVGPRTRMARNPAHSISQSKIRCLSVNFRHGLSILGVAGVATKLEYWRLTGGVLAGRRWPIGDNDPDQLIASVLARVRALIERFDDPATPYLAQPAAQWAPRFSDYRHLERVAASEDEEW